MKLKALLLAAAVALGLGGTAQAADGTWTGLYLGANVGYLWGEVDAPSTFTGSIDPEGFLIGGQVGYDHQFENNMVLGVFAMAPALFVDDDDTVGAITFDADLEWAVALGLRGGYAFGNILPFVLAGYVIGEGNGTATGPGVAFDLTETHDGYVVGGGADYMFMENGSVGAQVAYIDMSEETYEFTTPADVGFEAFLLLVTANYRF